MSARDVVLARLRTARELGAPRQGVAAVVREYPLAGHDAPGSDAAIDLFARRVADYRATVHRATVDTVADVVGSLVPDVGDVVTPPGVPRDWLALCSAHLLTDDPARPLSAHELDAVATVVTGATLGIAETGTIVLDAARGEDGRRILTLVPDHHVCVVRGDRVVSSVPEGIRALDGTHPLTFVSGPSATSDIELERVEGVHGPRRLDVVILAGG